MDNEDKRCWNCLRRLMCNDYAKQKPHNEQAPDCHIDMVTFDDDYIYAINTKKGTCKTIILTPPYDDRSFSLDDLREKYGADLVIHEDPLHGDIYRYGNQPQLECWQQIGTTEGYA